MTHVDGVFSGRGSKRRALGTLALVATMSFALGWVRDLPRDGPPNTMVIDEPGVLMARPAADVGPEPLLQATAEPKTAPTRRKAPAPVEVADVPVVESEPVAVAEATDATAALNAEAATVDATAIEPLALPTLEKSRR